MTSLLPLLHRIANWKTLIFLLALYVSFPVYWLTKAEATINQLAGKTIGPIDLTFGINPARTLAMVAGYGPAARAFYARTELTVDLIYPLVYSLLLAVLLTMLFRNRSNRLVILLPFSALLFDYFENIAIVTLLTTYPMQTVGVALFCEVVKFAKWLSLGSSIGMIGYGLILRGMNRANRTDTGVKDRR